MKPFSSSTKPLLSFAQTTIIEKFVSACGDRLTELTQMEKYQLSAIMSLSLWGAAEDIELNGELGEDEQYDLLGIAQGLPFEVTGNVKAVLFMLRHEDIDNLAAILPAVNSYAKEDERLHP